MHLAWCGQKWLWPKIQLFDLNFRASDSIVSNVWCWKICSDKGFFFNICRKLAVHLGEIWESSVIWTRAVFFSPEKNKGPNLQFTTVHCSLFHFMASIWLVNFTDWKVAKFLSMVLDMHLIYFARPCLFLKIFLRRWMFSQMRV